MQRFAYSFADCRHSLSQAWRLRWAGIFGCAAAKAVATSLLELKVAHGADGDVPSCCEVLTTFDLLYSSRRKKKIDIVSQNILDSEKRQLFFLAFEAFFALSTRPVFHVPCTVCRRFGFRALHQCWRSALLLSDTGVWFGRCGVASSLFPQSGTARTKVATSRAILLQLVPSNLFTRLRTTQPDTFPYNFVF